MLALQTFWRERECSRGPESRFDARKPEACSEAISNRCYTSAGNPGNCLAARMARTA